MFNALGIAGAFLTFLDLASRFSRFAADTEQGRFQVFLWVSFISVTVSSSLWMVLYSTVRQDLGHSRRRARLGAQASKIQHEMAEAVRRCAAGAKSYDISEDLRHVMALLSEHLRKRLGEAPYAITIKQTEPRSGRLRKVFRDGSQKLGVRAAGDDIKLEESPIYARFAKASRAKKMVYTGNTDQIPILEESFRVRAQTCGYRTVIGFPLRFPVILETETGAVPGSSDEVNFANLMGFFSIDAPRPGAFEGLLKRPKGAPREGTVLRDDDREPQDDLDVFYGLADSIATILMLTSAAASEEVVALEAGGKP